MTTYIEARRFCHVLNEAKIESIMQCIANSHASPNSADINN